MDGRMGVNGRRGEVTGVGELGGKAGRGMEGKVWSECNI